MSGKILIAGARGMVGSAIVRALAGQDLLTPTRTEVDWTDALATDRYLREQRPNQLYIAAARVGGIHANATEPAQFIAQNLQIELNLIQAAHRHHVERVLFLGSSCIYPKFAEQPMRESALLTGVLEPTNEPYAIAKIAGIKLCESFRRQYGCDFRSAMPTNLYGPGDNFDFNASHVIPALLRKFHEAKLANAASVSIWGSGTPKREFLHVDDLARGAVHLMNLPEAAYWDAVQPMCSHVNLGSGVDCSIRELAETIGRVVDFTGALDFDASKPDGTPRKLLDVGLAEKLGFRAQIGLEDGLRATYQWFLASDRSALRC
jgi:GDP-L-fucose synthase